MYYIAIQWVFSGKTSLTIMMTFATFSSVSLLLAFCTSTASTAAVPTPTFANAVESSIALANESFILPPSNGSYLLPLSNGTNSKYLNPPYPSLSDHRKTPNQLPKQRSPSRSLLCSRQPAKPGPRDIIQPLHAPNLTHRRASVLSPRTKRRSGSSIQGQCF